MTATNTDSAIDLDDVQGLVRFAHGQLSESAFLLLRVKDPVVARQWLRAAPVTSAQAQSPRPQSALQVAFTAAGLLALGLEEGAVMSFSETFSTGMSGAENRSRRLGDTGNNHPQHWRWGSSRDDNPHVLLMVYTLPGKLTDYLRRMQTADFTQAFAVQQTLRSKSSGVEEPFGFVDGISQPLIDWQQSISTDPHVRAAYSNLLAPGEILLGYPNEYGLYTERPLLDPDDVSGSQVLPAAVEAPQRKDLGRNGSYLVLRQLAQDVTAFWRYVDEQSGADASGREQLAAAMVGRQRDGTPLLARQQYPVAAASGADPGNQFTFDDDPLGEQCPLGAHIRRANPRTGDFPPGTDGLVKRLQRTLGFGRRHPLDDLVASTRFHRILRRGRVYGSKLTPEQALRDKPLKKAQEERGLLFVCLGANIARQFEFVQNAWIDSSKFAGLDSEGDPLLGNREPLASGAATDRFSQPRPGKPAHSVQNLPQFVTVRGGAYFFLPGLRALTFITREH
jgi:Dyp-type peroxidase family